MNAAGNAPEPDAPKKYRIFIVEDNRPFREALAEVINRQPDLIVCGDAADVETALEQILICKPELVTVDMMFEGKMKGMELIRSLKQQLPAVSVVVISMNDPSHYGEAASQAGADGYVRKNAGIEKVLTTIRGALRTG